MAPTFPLKSTPSLQPKHSPPSAIRIHPGSGSFFLAEQHKDKIIVAFQQRNPGVAERIIAAAKRGKVSYYASKTAQSITVFLTLLLANEGAQALMRVGYTDLSHTISATTGIINSKRVTNAQRQVIVDEVAQCIYASRSLARFRVGVTAAIVAGGFGLSAWIWMTGGREVAMERAKAAAKSNN